MTDSANIKIAADRLQRALRTLEGSLLPLVEKVSLLEKQAEEAGSFQEDRAELTRQLDSALARERDMSEREKEFGLREAEFSALADDTTQELDRVIRQVRQVLGQDE